MELLAQSQGPLIGLMGWAATVVLILSSLKYNAVQQRTLVVCAWVVWMSPAFGALVHQGWLTADSAMLLFGGMTVGLVLLVSVTAVHWWRPKH